LSIFRSDSLLFFVPTILALMLSRKLITVSYRLPYRFTASSSQISVSASPGGLATALLSFFENHAKEKGQFDELHWMGVSNISKKVFDKASGVRPLVKNGITMHPVFHTPTMREKFHDGFCNSILWPLFLYFPSFVVFKNDYFDSYVDANRMMCEAIEEIYRPGDIIWVHDYHWMLLPAMLREKLPDARIGFFLHIPFPTFELFRLLPKSWRSRMLAGVSGADVAGFQTEDFVRHFVDCLSRTAGIMPATASTYLVGGKRIRIDKFPISIDYEKFDLVAQLPQTKRQIKKIREGLRVEKVVLSVDRLDYTKGIFSRLESFELLLNQNPELREKVSYVLLMVPTRESIQKYKENKQTVEGLISRINGLYSTISWTPIIYYYQTMDLRDLVALYGAADIALVVPWRDGMNLVAKEFIASRPEGNGVLILSETAGAADELRHAIMVNANDRQEIADALLEALLMPSGEQGLRMRRMQDYLKRNTVMGWAEKYLSALCGAAIPESRLIG
jgi:trehalose 6-phosphate synthase/phosphatase